MTLIVATYFYVFREQEIRLDLIPAQFEYCGRNISEGDINYDEVVTVLTKQKGGWVSSSTNYEASQHYYAPAFQVKVIGKQVVVSYKTDEGFPQFIKLIKYNWSNTCAKYS